MDEKKRILIADDEPGIIRLLKDYFEMQDYQVIAAENGLEVLGQLNKEPDLILLDIQMAQKNGIETLREIRAMKDGADIPVIMLTGVEDKGFVLESAKLGICGYILKPFYSTDLLKRIHQVFEREEQKHENSWLNGFNCGD